jgi:RNA:NAD 2'-phosphotransferase (TPT1/KptA family)
MKTDKDVEMPAKMRNRNGKISRKLSTILRHNAIKIGLEMDPAGFVGVDELMEYLKARGHKSIQLSVL